MHFVGPAVLLMGAAISAAAPGDAPRAVTLDGAAWIWSAPDAAASAPAGTVFFRASVNVSEQALIKTAELVITADNLYAFYVNGKPAGEGHENPNLWSRPKRFDVSALLLPGNNVLAVEATNTAHGPAGLLVKLVVELDDGHVVELASGRSWKCSEKEDANWQDPSFDDNPWAAASVVAEFGARPWGKISVPATSEPAGAPPDAARQARQAAIAKQKDAARQQRAASPSGAPLAESEPPADYGWPEGLVFLGDDCSLYRPLQHAGTAGDSLSVTVFMARKSRAFPEHDLPAPVKMGRKLYALQPARPGTQPRLLLDAGTGAIGSPSVSWDGRWIYLAMAAQGQAFFHIWRLPAAGGTPQQLTDGPFHDIDPAELPDGRIVFTSTRIGLFEEYHNPPSRALFVMGADGSAIRPITNTFVFDNEPEVLADGRIVFIRSDNFFGRGKVETLLHAVHPDGTEGYTEFGLDNGPEYGGRLRAFYCGSPAPLADGRLAFVSSPGITVGRLGAPQSQWRHLRLDAGDVAAVPDGRLLCSLGRRIETDLPPAGKQKRAAVDMSYEKLALIDSRGGEEKLYVVHASSDAVHSPVFLGPRPRPPVLPEKVTAEKADEPGATGVLFCHNARFTKNTTAGWQHVRAIRVLAGQGLTVRSSHSYIVHAGTEVVELGTVPLAPDGSFCVEVPADTAIAFQAVDGEGRSELNEMSWIYVRPGEQRSCVGCHQPRQAAPPWASPAAQAGLNRPLKLLGRGRPPRFRGNNAAVTGLMELQLDRYREVAGLSRHADSSDPQATGRQEVASLVAELAGPDEDLKISAAQRLAVFRDRSAAAALAERLTHPSREVRVAAAVALAACGTRESLPALLAALEDHDPLVVQGAALALENLTAHAEPVDGFTPVADHRQRSEAWRAWLASHDWATIEAELIGRLRQDDRDVERRAAVALGHVGGEAARSALREYLVAHRDQNPYPEWRQGHRSDGTRFNSLSAANPRTLQEATRALGYLQDSAAVPLLAETLAANSDPDKSNLFLAEAAAEALGRIGTPAAETALAEGLLGLKDYFYYVGWYGDHGALYACHASPVHYFITEALDALGAKQPANIVPALIRSVPTDVDRALMLPCDDCETLVGRVIRRLGAEQAVVETCLAILGDPQAPRSAEIEEAVKTTYTAWGGTPDPENRAAHILALTCRDRTFEPRIRAALERYRTRPEDPIARVFDTGIPRVQVLPVKNWVCFFLARALGHLADPRSLEALLAALEQGPAEAATGRPDPTGPGVLFLHNGLTPCWRAAVAWALGRLGDRRAGPALLAIVGDLDNALDTRHAAAEALGRLADPARVPAIRALAAEYPEVSVRRALLRAVERLSPEPTAARTATSAFAEHSR